MFKIFHGAFCQNKLLNRQTSQQETGHIFIRIFKSTLFSIENKYFKLAKYRGKTVYLTENSILIKFSQQRWFCNTKSYQDVEDSPPFDAYKSVLNVFLKSHSSTNYSLETGIRKICLCLMQKTGLRCRSDYLALAMRDDSTNISLYFQINESHIRKGNA